MRVYARKVPAEPSARSYVKKDDGLPTSVRGISRSRDLYMQLLLGGHCTPVLLTRHNPSAALKGTLRLEGGGCL